MDVLSVGSCVEAGESFAVLLRFLFFPDRPVPEISPLHDIGTLFIGPFFNPAQGGRLYGHDGKIQMAMRERPVHSHVSSFPSAASLTAPMTRVRRLTMHCT